MLTSTCKPSSTNYIIMAFVCGKHVWQTAAGLGFIFTSVVPHLETVGGSMMLLWDLLRLKLFYLKIQRICSSLANFSFQHCPFFFKCAILRVYWRKKWSGQTETAMRANQKTVVFLHVGVFVPAVSLDNRSAWCMKILRFGISFEWSPVRVRLLMAGLMNWLDARLHN